MIEVDEDMHLDRDADSTTARDGSAAVKARRRQ